MVVAALVIAYILVLRYLYQRELRKERQKAGVVESAGPADYATIKKTVGEISERLALVEREYHELAQRLGGPQS